MLRSRLLCKTTAEGPRDAITASHKLLCRASFFKPGTASGLWETLPLGKLVLDKLERIVSEELLDGVDGCQKVDLPCLMGVESWERSGRWNGGGEGEMFRLKDRKDKLLMLAPTHEEAVTEMITGMYGIVPAALLPLSVFQVGRKFRDELRPRAGLLRAREFIMKDLYSFDESQDKAMQTYARVCEAYMRIFESRLGVKVLQAQAASGAMGGNYSHEFHFESEAGEDSVLKCTVGEYCANVEAVTASSSSSSCTCSKCSCKGKGELVLTKCVEVGHSFFLGTRYSAPLKARCVPQGQTQPQPMQMGCYGLGMTRIAAALVERSHDAHGIVWPASVAPFQLVVVPSPQAPQDRTQAALAMVMKGRYKDKEVLIDDRGSNVGFGAKMKDAKLLGIPHICTIEHDGTYALHRRVLGGSSGGMEPVGAFADFADVLRVVKQQQQQA